MQEFSITKSKQKCTPYMPDNNIFNPIDPEYLEKLKMPLAIQLYRIIWISSKCL